MQADASPALPGQVQAGPVVALWRYPVKSMMGEELNCSGVTGRGLLGDRQFAVVDRSTGKVGGAKNPGKRGNFFGFRAAYAEPPQAGARFSPVRITLPDGTVVTSGQADLEQILSRVSGRDVAFEEARPDNHSPAATAGEYWPDMPGLDYRDTVTDFEMPAGTFFDIAVVHRVMLSIDVARCSSSPARRLLNSTRSRAAGTNPITAIQGQTTDQAPAKA